jgi:hypothetical protein
MPDLTAKRTLVKSPPELWSELSEVERLARHLGAFGEIKITKLEPEHTVAWEGESASGTVSIEPSGWGTRVTLTAQLGDGEEAPATGVGVAEQPTAETAAGEGVEAVPDGEEAAEPAVDEPEVAEQSWERVETAGAEDPLGEQRVAEAPTEAEPMEADCVEAECFEAESVADEPAAEESAVEERVTPQQAEPIQAKPRRKRGFLAWLFRPRTSAQVSAPPAVTTPLEPGGQAPVVEESVFGDAPVGEEAPLTEEAPAGDTAPGEESPVRGETAPVKEPRVVEESAVVEEASVVDGVPVVGDAPGEEASAPEALPASDEPASSGEPRVMLVGEPVGDEWPPTPEQSARREHGAPVADGHRTPAEESPESEGPAVADELAPEHSSPHPGLDPERAQAILDDALDALGSAHHRPFSRG